STPTSFASRSRPLGAEALPAVRQQRGTYRVRRLERVAGAVDRDGRTAVLTADRHAVIGHARPVCVERARVRPARTTGEASAERRALGQEVGTRIARGLELGAVDRRRRRRGRAAVAEPERRRRRARLTLAALTSLAVAIEPAVRGEIDAVLLQARDVGLHLDGHSVRCRSRNGRARAATRPARTGCGGGRRAA